MKTKFMKIFRRVVALVCVVPVLLCGMAMPASAASVTNGPQFLADGFEVGFPIQGSSNVTFSNHGSVTFAFVDTVLCDYFDITFTCIGAPVLGIDLYANGSSASIGYYEVVHVGDKMYRCYGSFIVRNISQLSFRFITDSSVVSSVSIRNFTLGNYSSVIHDVEAYCEIMALPYEATIHYVSTDEVNYRAWTTYTDSDPNYGLAIRVEDWRKYDYIDILMYTNVGSVTNVTCNMNGVAVPCDVTYLNNDVAMQGTYTYTIRMDLRSLDRTALGNAVAVVSGSTMPVGSLNYVDVMSVHGYVSYDSLNAWQYLGYFLYQQINSIVNYLRQLVDGGSASSDLSQGVQDAVDDLQQVDDSLQSVVRPDIDSVDVDVAKKLNPVVLTAYGNIFGILFNNEYISVIFILAFTLALVAYVLYGKR